MIVVDRLGNVITNGEKQNNLLEKLYGTVTLVAGI